MKALVARYQEIRNIALDTRASVELSRLGISYIPWTASALRPAAMAQLLNEVIVNGRRTIVEFGAGISTIYFSKLLASTGGTLISIEDDTEWAKIVSDLLAEQGLEKKSKVVIAPLKSCDNGVDGLLWYDSQVVKQALTGQTVDLVLVDGPKAHKPDLKLARYPAFPEVQPYLAERAAIALDDFARPGEQEVIERWKRLPTFDLTVTRTRGGMALCHRGTYFNTEI